MSDSLINIIINTVKKGHGDKETVSGIKKLSAGFKELTGISLSSMTVMGAAGLAIGGVTKFMKDAVTETVAYATEVDNLSRLLGISTEDTSRLIQASDDLFLSQEKLSAGLQAATRQGIDVSIEGLKKLAEQYLALPAGVERSEFVLKTFGRSGAEMGKLMEQGAAGIDAATAAIADNMVITGQSMKDIIHYKQSVDNLNDSWQGAKYTVGSMIIPQLDLLLRNLTQGTDVIEAHAEAVKRVNDQWGMNTMWHAMGLAKDKSAEFRAEIEKLNAEFYGQQEALGAAEEEMAAYAAEQEILNQKLSTMKQIMGGKFGQQIDDFRTGVRDLKTEQAGVVARIKELEGLNYLTPEQKAELDDLRLKHQDISLAIQDMQSAHETAMKTMAMNMIIEMASSDGLTENEVANINDIMVAWGLWDEETARVIDNINAIDLNDANMEIDGLQANILGIPDRTVTITVKARYEGDYTGAGWSIGKMEMDRGEDINKNGIIGAARGADFVVPPGYPNDSFPMLVTSGERVQVTPAGKNAGGNTNNFYISGAGDPNAVANAVMRKLRLQGAA